MTDWSTDKSTDRSTDSSTDRSTDAAADRILLRTLPCERRQNSSDIHARSSSDSICSDGRADVCTNDCPDEHPDEGTDIGHLQRTLRAWRLQRHLNSTDILQQRVVLAH